MQEDSIQRQVHLRSHQGKTMNSKNNSKRFRILEQFTRSVRSIQSCILDTYKNRNLNRRN